MEGFLNALGTISMVVLVLIGLVAGWIAGRLTGRNTLGYMLLGAVGAVLLPFLLVALGVGILALGGIILVFVLAAVGAVLLIAIGRAIFGEKR